MRSQVDSLTPDLDLSSENAVWPFFWRSWISFCNSASISRDCVDRAGAARAEAESGVRACSMQGLVLAKPNSRRRNKRDRQINRTELGEKRVVSARLLFQGDLTYARHFPQPVSLHSPTQRPSMLHIASGRACAQHVGEQQLVARLYRGSNSV